MKEGVRVNVGIARTIAIGFLAAGLFLTPGCKSTTFEPVQNDLEGYNHHPWGQRLDDFKLSSQGKTCVELSAAKFDEPLPNGWSDDLAWWSQTGHLTWHYTLLVLDQSDNVPNRYGEFGDKKYWTKEMRVFDDEAERTYYFFYKDRLALVAIDVATDPDEQLRKRYQSVKTSSFIDDGLYKSRHSIELFKRGSTNTRIYSVSSVMATAGWSTRLLIYIPDVSWKELGSDVNAKIAAVQLSEQNSRRDSQQNAQQEINRKVQ
jgi:hypothetical protein